MLKSRIVLSLVLGGLLSLSACAADDPSGTADDVSEDNGIGTSPSGDEPVSSTSSELQVICDVWDTYVCTLPNGLPSLCRYCVCSHICWGNPTNPNNCDLTTCI